MRHNSRTGSTQTTSSAPTATLSSPTAICAASSAISIWSAATIAHLPISPLPQNAPPARYPTHMASHPRRHQRHHQGSGPHPPAPSSSFSSCSSAGRSAIWRLLFVFCFSFFVFVFRAFLIAFRHDFKTSCGALWIWKNTHRFKMQ